MQGDGKERRKSNFAVRIRELRSKVQKRVYLIHSLFTYYSSQNHHKVVWSKNVRNRFAFPTTVSENYF